MATQAILNPLHLTEENKEQLRALVRRIMPSFERDLAEYAETVRREQLQQQLQRELAQVSQQHRQWMGLQTGTTVFPNTTTITSTAIPPPWLAQSAVAVGNSTAIKPGPVVYQSAGTGFTTYGPIDPHQGLTLRK